MENYGYKIMHIETGKLYKVNHSRKGTFIMRVTAVGEIWIDGVIVEGKTTALVPGNEREQGEKISVRRALCNLTEHGE